jgi:hypothetical protein
MQRARAFFYVCAGISLLALSYHLGASSVHAQTGTTIDGGAIAYVQGLPAGYRASGVVGRTFYSMDGSGNGIVQPSPIPGTSRVIATDPAYFSVMLENGDMFVSAGSAGWTRLGNLFGLPTPAAQQTWGQVKASYRK